MEKLITKELKDQIIQQIRNWWEVNGGVGPAVIGISGGKDSSVVAALCVEALGRDKVFGVMIPNGTQKDIADSIKLCKHLKIENFGINIGPITNEMNMLIHTMNGDMVIKKSKFKPIGDSSRYITNIPPRVRMTMLYAVAQNLGGRVIGTGNASEMACGYFTWGGDCISDFNPLTNLFVDEVIELGKLLKLPTELIEKKPADGLSGKTDEENLEFTYADVKKVVLKTDGWQEQTPFADIERKIKNNEFKFKAFNIPTIRFYRDKYGKITSVM